MTIESLALAAAQRAYDRAEPGASSTDMEAIEDSIDGLDFADDVIDAWVPISKALRLKDSNLVGALMVRLYRAKIERLAMRMEGKEIPPFMKPAAVANALTNWRRG